MTAVGLLLNLESKRGILSSDPKYKEVMCGPACLSIVLWTDWYRLFSRGFGFSM